MAFAVLGFFNLDLLNRHELLALKLKVKLDCFARFLRNNIIELASEVLAGEGKVLGQHNLAEDVLAIGLLHTSLVVIGQLLEHLLWLLRNDLVQHRDELEELGRHLVDLHCDSVGNLLQISVTQVTLHPIHRHASPNYLHWVSRLHAIFDTGLG